MAELEQRILAVEIADGAAGRGAGFKPLPFSSADVRREIGCTKRRRVFRVVAGVIIAALAALVIAGVFVVRVPERIHEVPTAAMAPVLEQGQYAYVTSFSDQEGIHAGDVVAYRSLSGATLFRRVVACPGEWVGVTDDKQFAVSDHPIAEGAIVSRSDSEAVIVNRIEVPDNTYFVIGDAETPDADSLSQPDYIVVSDQIVGRALFRLWPPAGI